MKTAILPSALVFLLKSREGLAGSAQPTTGWNRALGEPPFLLPGTLPSPPSCSISYNISDAFHHQLGPNMRGRHILEDSVGESYLLYPLEAEAGLVSYFSNDYIMARGSQNLLNSHV